MKKLSISLILFLCITCFGFARISLQIEGDAIGVGCGITRNPFSEGKKTSVDMAISPPFFSNLNLKMYGEFASDDLKPFHFFMGGALGLKGYLVMECQMFGGFSYHLADTEKKRLELVTTFGLSDSPVLITYPIVSTAVDLQFLPQERRGFYWGFGVNIETLLGEMEYYKKFGMEYIILEVTGICANIGWKL